MTFGQLKAGDWFRNKWPRHVASDSKLLIKVRDESECPVGSGLSIDLSDGQHYLQMHHTKVVRFKKEMSRHYRVTKKVLRHLASARRQLTAARQKKVSEAKSSRRSTLITVQEAMKKFKVSRATLYRWRVEGLRSFLVRGVVLFKPRDIARFMCGVNTREFSLSR